MPEGPEVRVIADQLAKEIKGKVLTSFDVIGGRFVNLPPDGIEHFKKELPVKLTAVNCKGKFIWFTFGNSWYLFNTLGMTGCWGTEQEKHAAVRLTFEDGSNIFFMDPRHFGTIKFAYGSNVLQDKLESLGLDLLDIGLTKKDASGVFKKKIQNSNATLAEILMNQKIFSGVGNYLKAEALYRAKVSPWRKGKSLSDDECLALLQHATDIMVASYKDGGTTIATYKNFEGEVGHYSSKLLVYGKTIDPLGNTVKSEETPDKRTTWWVPKVQK